MISLYQPWAEWIMRGCKTIETRTHNRLKSLRGKTILIHAGQTTDTSDAATNNPYLTDEQILATTWQNGLILGSAFVYDAQKLSKEHSKAALIECEFTERYGLFLNQVNRFEIPIPEKGEMGIWYYDMYNMCKLKKQK